MLSRLAGDPWWLRLQGWKKRNKCIKRNVCHCHFVETIREITIYKQPEGGVVSVRDCLLPYATRGPRLWLSNLAALILAVWRRSADFVFCFLKKPDSSFSFKVKTTNTHAQRRQRTQTQVANRGKGVARDTNQSGSTQQISARQKTPGLDLESVGSFDPNVCLIRPSIKQQDSLLALVRQAAITWP